MCTHVHLNFKLETVLHFITLSTKLFNNCAKFFPFEIIVYNSALFGVLRYLYNTPTFKTKALCLVSDIQQIKQQFFIK